jgi:hypothetical protein
MLNGRPTIGRLMTGVVAQCAFVIRGPICATSTLQEKCLPVY